MQIQDQYCSALQEKKTAGGLELESFELNSQF